MTINGNPLLSPSVLGRHFPDSGKGRNPRIDTDGKCLIIRHVMIQGKPHDIRIWRFHPDGKPISISLDSPFLKQTIVEVQSLAQGLFAKENFGNPCGVKLHFSDADAAKKVCWQESLTNPVINTEMTATKNRDIYDPMEKIHNKFFHTLSTAWSADPNEKLVLYPQKKVKKEDLTLPAGKPASTSVPVKKKSKAPKQSMLPDHIKFVLPKILQVEDASTSTDGSSVSSTSAGTSSLPQQPEEVVSGIAAALEAAQATYPKGDFLEGISYPTLVQYSMSTPTTGDTAKLKKAYDAYVTVLKTPAASGSDNETMRGWLRHHYLAAYNAHKELEELWVADVAKGQGDKRILENFDEWCKYYAAKAIAGYVLVPLNTGESIDPLVAELEKTTIPGLATATPSKPERYWFNPSRLWK